MCGSAACLQHDMRALAYAAAGIIGGLLSYVIINGTNFLLDKLAECMHWSISGTDTQLLSAASGSFIGRLQSNTGGAAQVCTLHLASCIAGQDEPLPAGLVACEAMAAMASYGQLWLQQLYGAAAVQIRGGRAGQQAPHPMYHTGVRWAIARWYRTQQCLSGLTVPGNLNCLV